MDLREEYNTIHDASERIAGELSDIPRRAAVLLTLYEHSGGLHHFPLMAAHGALWASGYFERGGAMGRLIARRYFYNRHEMAFRIGILEDFAAAFRRVNRQVCVDTVTNYRFVERFGEREEAAECVPSDLLGALNRLHHARRKQRSLSAAEARQIFETSFQCEQEVTVAPGVRDAVAQFECRVMKFLCLHPVVRFAYFPRWRYLFFRDFARQQERIRKGQLAYRIGQKRGWKHVLDALYHYRTHPLTLTGPPESRFSELETHSSSHPPEHRSPVPGGEQSSERG